MKYELPKLGFSPDALSPFLSAETLEYHHGKHHRGYVDKLNKLVAGTDLERLDLVELVRKADGATLQNAGQHFNHSLYWRCIAPEKAPAPEGELARAIDKGFGSLRELKTQFTKEATGIFGSGWCWLVRGKDGRLAIRATSNAGCPVTQGEDPILTCDVWEHAYYIDYRNARADYVEAFWKAIDWGFVGRSFEHPDRLLESIL